MILTTLKPLKERFLGKIKIIYPHTDSSHAYIFFIRYQSFCKKKKKLHLFLMAEISFFKTKALVYCCVCWTLSVRSLLEHLGALKSTRGLQWRAGWTDTEQNDVERQRRLPVRALANRWSRFGHWALIKSTNWPLHPLPRIPLSLPPSVSSSIHSKSRSSLQSRWPADGGLRHGRPAAHGNQTTW